MRYMFKFTMVIFFISTFSGCVFVASDDWKKESNGWYEHQEKNKNVIHQLEINDSRADIIEKLGAPDFSEAFTKDNVNYRVLFYRTQRVHHDNKTSLDETTPLIFVSNQLVGWGRETLDSIR